MKSKKRSPLFICCTEVIKVVSPKINWLGKTLANILLPVAVVVLVLLFVVVFAYEQLRERLVTRIQSVFRKIR